MILAGQSVDAYTLIQNFQKVPFRAFSELYFVNYEKHKLTSYKIETFLSKKRSSDELYSYNEICSSAIKCPALKIKIWPHLANPTKFVSFMISLGLEETKIGLFFPLCLVWRCKISSVSILASYSSKHFQT